MPANTPLLLKKTSQQAMIKYAELASMSLLSGTQLRATLRSADQNYMREVDFTREQTRARVANKLLDPNKIQNVTIPVIMPQVEASVNTLTEIFCSEFPIFKFVAKPDKADIALQYNTIMEDNQQRGGWIRQLKMFFRDGLKYNINALECTWCTENIWAVETDTGAANLYNKNLSKGKQSLWSGNKLRRMDMYNTFFDTRVAPAEIHTKGEFAGYVELMSRMQLKRFINSLQGDNKFVDNATAAFMSNIGGSGDNSSTYGYYEPQINPDATYPLTTQSSFDWLGWAGLMLETTRGVSQNAYEVKTLYARIIPGDFDISVPAKNMPQIWKFIVVNNTVLIFAERQTNVHDYLPIIFGQPLEDGLRFQTKSFAKNIEPFQQIGSALWNAKLASARRRLTDRGIYNPLLIREQDINSPEPNAKIPIRSSMYGKKLEEAYYQIPFHDENSQYFVQEADAIYRFSQITSGKNNPALGQFQKGNKNNPEWEQTMANANAMDKGMALFMEDQTFIPIKTILKLNILQYQPKGQIYSSSEQILVNIDPISIREQALDFKVCDGLLPAEKEINSDEMQVAFQTIQSTPQLQSGYNVVPMFTYIMKTRGLDGLEAFEKSPLQIQFEAMQAQWQQVAMESYKQGQKPPPQPVMPPELVAELQQKAQQAAPKTATSGSPQTTDTQAPKAATNGAAISGSDINIGGGNNARS